MDDAAIFHLIADLRDEMDKLRKQVNVDLTDLQGAVAELEDDHFRRRLRSAKQQ